MPRLVRLISYFLRWPDIPALCLHYVQISLGIFRCQREYELHICCGESRHVHCRDNLVYYSGKQFSGPEIEGVLDMVVGHHLSDSEEGKMESEEQQAI